MNAGSTIAKRCPKNNFKLKSRCLQRILVHNLFERFQQSETWNLAHHHHHRVLCDWSKQKIFVSHSQVCEAIKLFCFDQLYKRLLVTEGTPKISLSSFISYNFCKATESPESFVHIKVSMYGLKTYNLLEATNFHFWAF